MRLLAIIGLLILPGCLLPDTGAQDFETAWERGVHTALREGDRVMLVNALGYERDETQGVSDGALADGRTMLWEFRVCVDDRFGVVTTTPGSSTIRFDDGECSGLSRPEVDSDQAAAILQANSVVVPDQATRVAWLFARAEPTQLEWTLLVESPSGDRAYRVDAMTGAYKGQSV